MLKLKKLLSALALFCLATNVFAAGYEVIASSDAMARNQIFAGVQPYGALAVETTPTTIFNDYFDGGTVDTTNRWVIQQVTGTATQSNGSLILAPTTTASAYTAAYSIPTFPTPGAAFQLWAATVVPTIATNNLQFWGIATIPGTPTTAAPITTGIGYQIDAAGAFKAVLYSGGSLIGSCDLTAYKSDLTDGFAHGYAFFYRADAIIFVIDTPNVPICTLTGLQTASAAIPTAVLSVNSSTPPIVTPSTSYSLITLADYGKNSTQMVDGTYAFRKATVDGRGSFQVAHTGNLIKTYSSSSNLTVAAAATDIYCVTGNATTTSYITRLIVSATQTTGGVNDVLLIKRSTVDTGGTSTNPAATPHDSTDAAASTTLVAYTANPAALGTAVGTPIRRGFLPVVGATSIVNPVVTFDFGLLGREIILRGTTQQVCLNLNGATLTGGVFDISVEWFEK